ncbi:MAG TPA: metallophosphoesterase [Gammaproteobacteria bacterium]|nr:metallophosphoesterase [Gammaproteobacteria bacterium]
MNKIFKCHIVLLLPFLFLLTFSQCGFALIASPASSHYFLTIADIHFDPFMACQQSTIRPCPILEQLRQAPASEWPAIFKQYDQSPPRFRQETNYALLLPVLAAAKQVAMMPAGSRKRTGVCPAIESGVTFNKNSLQSGFSAPILHETAYQLDDTSQPQQPVQFVLVLGDFLAHDFRMYYRKYSLDKSIAGYRAFVLKTLTFLNQQLAETFPDIDVYSVIGNNDSYQQDYISTPNGPFFKDAGALWASLVKDKVTRADMQRQFPAAGYYAVTLTPSLRLIVLNSVLFSNKIFDKKIDIAAETELTWLQQQLEQANANKQKVMIAMHIPVSIDMVVTGERWFALMELWQVKYKLRFEEILRQFSTELLGVFTGHLHADWNEVIKLPLSTPITINGTPSVSPIFGNDPGFKMYQYDLSEKSLDFTTYECASLIAGNRYRISSLF